MLMLEHLDTMAETAALAISNIKFDKNVVWENGSQNGSSSTANFLQNMAHTLPPMMQVMKEIGGLDVPETLVKMRQKIDGNGASPAAEARLKPAPKESEAPQEVTGVGTEETSE